MQLIWYCLILHSVTFISGVCGQIKILSPQPLTLIPGNIYMYQAVLEEHVYISIEYTSQVSTGSVYLTNRSRSIPRTGDVVVGPICNDAVHPCMLNYTMEGTIDPYRDVTYYMSAAGEHLCTIQVTVRDRQSLKGNLTIVREDEQTITIGATVTGWPLPTKHRVLYCEGEESTRATLHIHDPHKYEWLVLKSALTHAKVCNVNLTNGQDVLHLSLNLPASRSDNSYQRRNKGLVIALVIVAFALAILLIICLCQMRRQHQTSPNNQVNYTHNNYEYNITGCSNIQTGDNAKLTQTEDRLSRELSVSALSRFIPSPNSSITEADGVISSPNGSHQDGEMSTYDEGLRMAELKQYPFP